MHYAFIFKGLAACAADPGDLSSKSRGLKSVILPQAVHGALSRSVFVLFRLAKKSQQVVQCREEFQHFFCFAHKVLQHQVVLFLFRLRKSGQPVAQCREECARFFCLPIRSVYMRICQQSVESAIIAEAVEGPDALSSIFTRTKIKKYDYS